MKVCLKCEVEKDKDLFCKDRNKKDGLNIYCRECVKNANKNRYELNREVILEKNKNSYVKNKETRLSHHKEYRKNNRGKINEYFVANKEKLIIKKKEYYLLNKDIIKSKRNEYKETRNEIRRQKVIDDPLFRLETCIRSRLRKCIMENGHKKKSRTNEILGCSYLEFKLYLESKFEPWMTWGNHGKYNGELNFGWDLDHIIPLSSAKSEDEILKLSHYTNLQPLCSQVNRYIKRDNINYKNVIGLLGVAVIGG